MLNTAKLGKLLRNDSVVIARSGTILHASESLTNCPTRWGYNVTLCDSIKSPQRRIAVDLSTHRVIGAFNCTTCASIVTTLYELFYCNA